MDLDLSGRSALVTGGGKGIGAAISRELAQMGARVVINYRSDREAAERTASQLDRATIFQADVGNPQQAGELISQTGPFDVLVNNAGVLRDRLLLRMTADDWDTVIRTDLSAAFYLTRACVPQMLKARWGRIVNISSIVGLGGNPGQANYAAAKAGIIGLTKSLAKELGARTIRVNAVAPGYIDTAMTRELSDDVRKAIVDATPLRAIGQPSDVANAVLFLASPLSRYITGCTLPVDGGLGI